MRLAMEIGKCELHLFCHEVKTQHFSGEMGNKIRGPVSPLALTHPIWTLGLFQLCLFTDTLPSTYMPSSMLKTKTKQKNTPSGMVFWAKNNVKAEFILTWLCQSALENDLNPKIWNHLLLSLSISPWSTWYQFIFYFILFFLQFVYVLFFIYFFFWYQF